MYSTELHKIFLFVSMPCCLDSPCNKDDSVKIIDEIRMTITCKHLARRWTRLEGNDTLAPAYNEFGYNEQPAITSRFLCIKIIDCNVTSSFFCIFLIIVSGNHCKMGPIHNEYQVTRCKFLQLTNPLSLFHWRQTSNSVTDELVAGGIQCSDGFNETMNDTAEPPSQDYLFGRENEVTA